VKKTPIAVRIPLVIVLLGVVASVGALAFSYGENRALESLAIRQVSAKSVASAMRNDVFYSSYRENTLLVTGSIATITDQHSRQTIEFATSGHFKSLCHLTSRAPDLRVGERITIVTEAYAALRRPSAVLLNNCLVLTAR